MAMEAVLQVRMNADLKQEVEELFRSLGTSFAEAVRIFAKRSVDVGGMPFAVSKEKTLKGFGCLHKYANTDLIPLEKSAWEKAAVEKYVQNLS